MANEDSLYVRVVAEDHEKAAQGLDRVGDAGAKAMGELGAASNAASSRLAALSERMNQLGGIVRLQHHGLQNLNYQLQDVAIQAGAGTNAFQILLQQGGHIASSFAGPLGVAIAGLATGIGVAGIAFQTFSSEAEDAESATKAFDRAQRDATDTVGNAAKSIRELTEAFKGLNDVQKTTERDKLSDLIAAQEKALVDLGAQARKTVADLMDVRNMPDLSFEGSTYGGDPLGLDEANQRAEKLAGILARIDAGDDMQDIANDLREVAKEAAAANGSLDPTSVRLNEIAVQAGKAGTSLKDLREQFAVLNGQPLPGAPAGQAGGESDREKAERLEREKTQREAAIRLERQALEDGKKAADQAVKDLHTEAEEIRKLQAEKDRAAKSEKDRRDREATQQAERVKDARKDAETEAANQKELAEAYADGAEAVAKIKREQDARKEVQAAGLELTSKEGKELYALALAAEEAAAATEKLAEKERQRTKWAEEDARARAKAREEYQDIVDDQNKEKQRARESAEKLLQEPALQAIRNIQTALGDAIYNGLNGEIGSVKDFFGTIADIGKRALAQTFSVGIMQPFLQGAGGAGGAGGGGFGNVIGGINQSINSSGIGQAVNSFGANIGFAPNVGGQGSFFTSTLSSTVGAGFAGYSVGTGLSGMLGGNEKNSQVGGAAGAVAGAIIGSAIPIVGTALGSFIGGSLGGLLGGVFGNEPSNKEQGRNANLLTGVVESYGQTGKKFSEENDKAAATITDAAIQYSRALEEATGGSVGLQGFDIAVGSRDGTKLGIGDTQTTYATAEEASAALIETITNSLKGAGRNVTSLIGSGQLDFSDPEKAIKQIDLAAYIDGLAKPASAAGEALKEVNQTFSEAIVMARNLKLSTTELTAEWQRQASDIRLGVQAQIDARVAMGDSQAATSLALRQTVKDYDELMAAGVAVGANTDGLIEARNRDLNSIQAEAKARAEAERSRKRDVKDEIDARLAGAQGSESYSASLRQTVRYYDQLIAAGAALDLSTDGLIEARNRDLNSIQAAAKAQAEADRIRLLDVQAQIDAAVNGASAGSELAARLRQVDSFFVQLAQSGQELGADTSRLAQAQKEAAQATRDAYRAEKTRDIESFIASGDPFLEMQLSVKGVRQEFTELAPIARMLGMDVGALVDAQKRRSAQLQQDYRDRERADAEARAQQRKSAQDQVRDYIRAGQSGNELAIAIAEIRDRFADVSQAAREAGVSTKGLEQSMRQQIAAARLAAQEANKQSASSWAQSYYSFLGQTDPNFEIAAAQQSVADQYARVKAEAKRLNQGYDAKALEKSFKAQAVNVRDEIEDRRASEKAGVQADLNAYRAQGNPAKELEVQIGAVSQRFTELSKQADKLNLSETGLKAARDDQIAALKAAFERTKQAAKDEAAAFKAAGDPIAESAVQITAITRRYEEQVRKAKELSLSEDDLKGARDRQIKAVKDELAAQKLAVADRIAAFKATGSPLLERDASITAVQRDYEDLVKQAKLLGQSETGLAAARDRQIAVIKEQYELEKQGLKDRIAAFKAEGDPFAESAVAITAIRRDYEDLVKQAKALGESETGLKEARDRQIKAIEKQLEQQRQAAKDDIANFLAGTDPVKGVEAQIGGVVREFERLTEQAKLLKLSEEGLAAARDDQIRQIKEQAVQSAREAYQSARNELSGFFDGLADPLKAYVRQLDESRPGGLGKSYRENDAEIRKLFAEAQRTGNVEAIQKIPGLISTATQQLNQLGASSKVVQESENYYRMVAETLGKYLDDQKREAEKNAPAKVVDTVKSVGDRLSGDLTRLYGAFIDLSTKFGTLQLQAQNSQRSGRLSVPL